MSNYVRDYGFPFQPYDIQIQLMDTLYDSFENGKFSIVESPTGTGKSLSIICALSKWLEDFKCKQLESLTTEIDRLKLETTNPNDAGTVDWIEEQLNQISAKNSIHDLQIRLDRLKKHVTYAKELKKKRIRKTPSVPKPVSGLKRPEEFDDDAEDFDLIVRYDAEDGEDDQENSERESYRPKIYYCSRTHSQLSQFINEFKKTRYFLDNQVSLMMVPLSSRVNYCINPSVNRLNNLNMINEKCNDLRNRGQKCSMCNPLKMDEFREQILGNVCDLEEIVQEGKLNKSCPYYSTKMAVPDAEIVIMPYNILLHKSTRDHFGIQLKDSVVIVDEAHNLLETIANVHSVELQASHISNLLKYLSLYMAKYFSRFNAQNLKYLKQLVFICKQLLNFLGTCKENTSMDPLDLTIKLNVENLNIHELIQFIERSRISSKLHMFSASKNQKSDTKVLKNSGTLEFLKKMNNKNAKDETSKQETVPVDEYLNTSTVHLIKDFLNSLCNYNVDAKVLVTIGTKDSSGSSFKYILLGPGSHFKEILTECRSVILCGGTMKPFEDYVNQLYKPLNIPKDRTLFFSCNHVISDDKLIAMSCSKGPNNVSLNYSYSSRNRPEVINETGELLLQLCQVIPKGIVVFFPSYDYEESLLKQWEKSGILNRMEKTLRKRVFKEPKKSSLVPATLNSYTKFINSSRDNSAVLFSVIGGKMSEGINFSDDLGRAVIVIGLPFANRNSIELSEKINYLNRQNPDSGNQYYENLCLRAVNQSIGRAIRHQNDYASIILIDERYEKPSIKGKLSDWIQTRFQASVPFGMAKSKIQEFFNEKRNKD